MTATLDGFDIIDTDTHLTEPPDLWTSRMSSTRWGDRIPHVVWHEKSGRERWVIGDKMVSAVAAWAVTGWHEFPPGHPPRLADADPGSWDPRARLEVMDRYGIYAQVLYPNLLAFFVYAFRALRDQDLMLSCVQAYNDFLIEFSESAPDRFVALTVLPFWDVDASVREIERADELGHRGVLFIGKPHKLGLPPIHDDHWAPIFATAQERQLSINFHVGFQEFTEEEFGGKVGRKLSRADYTASTSLSLLGNAETIANLLVRDVCAKYPELKFVSVESGFGWLPYLAETLDWQWFNSGAAAECPEREVPSFYLRRQVFGTFWYERESVARLCDLWADNLMFETDYPHPTSLIPSPNSCSQAPRVMAAESFKGVSPDVTRKVLYENAARLYHVRGPATRLDVGGQIP